MPTLLTKSKFLNGLSCPRLLWLMFHEPQKVAGPDEHVQFLFAQGHEVGELAKQLFPQGLDIPSDNFMGSIRKSKELLKEKKPLFEAGFMHARCYARADVLQPNEDGWDLIEVKSSGKVKEEHLHDVAFQKAVYEGAGLNIRKCFLMHVNMHYVRQGDINVNALLVAEEVTKKVEALKQETEDDVRNLLGIISSPEPPQMRCASPDNCQAGCWDDLPDDNVFTLYWGGKKAVELYQSGVARIADIPSDQLNGKQLIQKEAVTSKKPHVNGDEIAKFLHTLHYPLHFLDFETVGSAIPLFDGTSPFQQIPFQFSLHVVQENGTASHKSFLAEGSDDPRPAFTKALAEAVGDSGSVVAYNAPFEKRVIKDLTARFPEHKEKMESISSRLVDLLLPFRNFHVYHPKQNGSASIKHVLPALTGNGYSDMEISNGALASLRFTQMNYGNNPMPEEEKQELRAALEAYCALDTKAMVEIVEKLKNV